jgi:hypothetical protein
MDAGAGGVQVPSPIAVRGEADLRELLVNGGQQGTARTIATKVENVSVVNGFMIDLDCCILNPEVLGQESIDSADVLYQDHVAKWLDRDPVLCKAQVRNSGNGLHVLLRLDQPEDVEPKLVREVDALAKALHNALPGDPNLNGLNAMTRPVGCQNTKYQPPREVRCLREGDVVSIDEIFDLNSRLTSEPARFWMQILFGGHRVEPCPFCGTESLGVAGAWKVRCYSCGLIDADCLLYRLYSPGFLKSRTDNHHA